MNAREKDFDGSARVGADLVDVTAYYGKLKLLFGLVGTAALLTFAYQYWADPDWLLKSTMYYGHGYLWGSNSWGANSYETCLQGSYSDMGCTAQTTPAAFAIQMFLRNPGDRVTDLLILSVSVLPLILFFLLLVQRPDWGIIGIAAWTAISLVVHLVRLFQAMWAARHGERITSWLA